MSSSSVLDAIGWQDAPPLEPDTVATSTTATTKVDDDTRESILRQLALESVYASYALGWTHASSGVPRLSPDGVWACLFSGSHVHLVPSETSTGDASVDVDLDLGEGQDGGPDRVPIRSCYWIGPRTLLVHVSSEVSWGLHIVRRQSRRGWIQHPLWMTRDRCAREVGHAVLHASGDTVAIGWPGLSSGGLRANGSVQLYQAVGGQADDPVRLRLEREIFGWRDDDRLGSVLGTCRGAVAVASALDGHCKVDVLCRVDDCWELLGSLPTTWKGSGHLHARTLSLHVRTTGAGAWMGTGTVHLTVGESGADPASTRRSRVSVHQLALPRAGTVRASWQTVGHPIIRAEPDCGGADVHLCADARTLVVGEPGWGGAAGRVHLWKLIGGEWCHWASLAGGAAGFGTHVHASEDASTIVATDAHGRATCYARRPWRVLHATNTATVRPRAEGCVQLAVDGGAVRLRQRSPYFPAQTTYVDLNQELERAGVFAAARPSAEVGWAVEDRAALMGTACVQNILAALRAQLEDCGIAAPSDAVFQDQLARGLEGLLALGGRTRPLQSEGARARAGGSNTYGVIWLQPSDCISVDICACDARSGALCYRQRVQWVHAPNTQERRA